MTSCNSHRMMMPFALRRSIQEFSRLFNTFRRGSPFAGRHQSTNPVRRSRFFITGTFAFALSSAAYADPQRFKTFTDFKQAQTEIESAAHERVRQINIANRTIADLTSTLQTERPAHLQARNDFLLGFYAYFWYREQLDPVTGLPGLRTPEFRELSRSLPSLKSRAETAVRRDARLQKELGEAVGERTQLQRNFSEQYRDFYSNIALNGELLSPPIVRKVEVFGGKDLIYSAAWEDGQNLEKISDVLETTHGLVEQHTVMLKDVQDSLAVLRSKERASLAEWHELNQIAIFDDNIALFTNGTIELSDALVGGGLLSDSPRAGLAFEALYRGIPVAGHMAKNLVLGRPMASGFENKLKDIKLPDELVALSLEIGEGAKVPMGSIPALPIGETTALAQITNFFAPVQSTGNYQGIADDQIKNAIGLLYEILRTEGGDKLLNGILDNDRAWAFVKLIEQYSQISDIPRDEIVRRALAQSNDLIGNLDFVSSTYTTKGALADDVYSVLKNKKVAAFAVDQIKGFVASAGFNSIKAISESRIDQERLNAAYNLFVAGLKYQMTHNEADQAFYETQRITKVIDALRTVSGTEISQLTRNCCARQFHIEIGENAIQLDPDGEPLTLVATFSRALDDYHYKVLGGDAESFARFDSVSEAHDGSVQASVALARGQFASGNKEREMAIALDGSSSAFLNGGIDADPSSVAVLSIDPEGPDIISIRDFDQGADITHQLRIAALPDVKSVLRSRGKFTTPSYTYCEGDVEDERSGTFEVNLSNGELSITFQRDSDIDPRNPLIGLIRSSSGGLSEFSVGRGERITWDTSNGMPQAAVNQANQEENYYTIKGRINANTLEISEMQFNRHCAWWSGGDLDRIDVTWHPVLVTYE
ncbi:MAG: hypothetical protein ACSHXD_15215 [Marinosulfonomonas sp.]